MKDAYELINHTLVSLINEIWELEEKAGGRQLSLKIIPETPEAGKKLDPVAALYVFDRFMSSDGVPGVLIIGWDDRARCFRHRLWLQESVRIVP